MGAYVAAQTRLTAVALAAAIRAPRQQSMPCSPSSIVSIG
jgi:hypothetical protein